MEGQWRFRFCNDSLTFVWTFACLFYFNYFFSWRLYFEFLTEHNLKIKSINLKLMHHLIGVITKEDIYITTSVSVVSIVE